MEQIKSTEFVTEKPQGFLITGIGASAGGVQALKEFFEHVPEDSGIAYVVILHLSPDYDSQLAQILQAVTTIPVTQVTEKVKIEPNHIYVIPPNQHLIMEQGFIIPSINLYIEERRAPVDIFFRTLANTHGSRAISVVLSGTGANGSMGLKRVKEMGGVVYVQTPREAEFNEMPRNAIATELVDEVLPVAEIPGKIITYRNSLNTVEIAVEAEQRPEQQQQALREIFTQLRIRTGHDFSNYKRATLLRRIERRINVRNLPDLPSYAAFVHQNVDETNALLKDLLISVTNFFRDKKPFEAIELDILPLIFKDKTAADEVRIWVAGCATGEEAYSLAMLVSERTLGVIDTPKVQIFATDIDETAITTAREGLYTLNDTADVSPDQLRNFFNKEGDSYRVKREIREMILFANHNFLKDPPFSRLDLVTCRNVLIYLNATAQERVMETFHFALKPGGYLFLGSSESVDGASDLYATISRENHIYQAREVAIRNYPVPESVPDLQPRQQPAVKLNDVETRPVNRISFGELHQIMLEQYAPPSLVVNAEYEIMHMSEKVGSFLEFSGGEPTKNLLKLIKPELRLELRSALYQAVQRLIPIEARNIPFGKNGERQSVNIQVRPVTKADDTAKGFILVIFEQNQKKPDAETVVISSDEPVARQLEEELMQVKAQLKRSVEQHEYQAEELKASNEELQAMNEELRSAAEELETSKEELQSMNEELRTVNQELKVKIEEISVTSNNLQNLINSADVATIFLDRAFCTRLYTPAALKIFNLIPSDYGRPLSDITHRLEYSDLLANAETVLEKLTIVEREVSTTDHHTFMMRVLPYRTSDDRINGIVITFFDITERKQAEKALQKSEAHLRLLLESAKDYAIFTLNPERHIVSWSSGAEIILGYTETEIIGKLSDLIFVPEDRQNNIPEKETQTADQEGRAENDRWHLRKDGSRFWGSGLTQPLRDDQGNTIGFVKIMRDLTEQRQMQQALRKSEEQFRRAIEAAPIPVVMHAEDGEVLQISRTWTELTGYTKEEVPTFDHWLTQAYGEGADAVRNYMQHLFMGNQQLLNIDFPVLTRQGKARYWSFSASTPGVLQDGRRFIVGMAVDITERKEAEEQLRSFNDLLEQQVTEQTADLRKTTEELQKNLTKLHQAEEVAQLGSWEYDIASGEISWSAGMYRMFGLPAGSFVKPETYLDFVIEEDVPIARKIVRNLREIYESFEDTLHLRVDGRTRTFQVKAVVLRNERGEPTKILGIDLDISEVKRLEEENLQIRLNQQKALLLAILEAQEKERRRISESLHNGVGQLLYATKMNLDQVAQKVPKELIQTTDNLLSDAIAETRRVSHELVPIILNDFGLVKAIENLCHQYDQSSLKINCEIDMDEPLASFLEIALYRMSQELLSNVIKHAQATQADILLVQEDDEIILKIRDNGQGISQEPGKKKGIGLRSIADRVKLLNGTFSITKPKTGKGTQVTIKIPVTDIN